MVTEAYDHIIAIVLVGVIFVGTVVAVPAAISFTTFQAVDQQQLRNTALNIFNAMLQAPGAPANWGSSFPFDQSNVQEFGLAYSSSFSKYVLDPDKVQRLDPKTPSYINYTYVRDLLELQGYGFLLSLFRPFNVDWDIEWSNETNLVWLGVTVTRTEDGAPIPGAVVKATIIATASNKVDKNAPSIAMSNVSTTVTTDLLGEAEISETIAVPSGYTLEKAIAVMHIIVAGMDTMVIASRDSLAQECLKINTYGDTITLTFWDSEYYEGDVPSGARWIESIYGYDLQDLMLLYEGGQGENSAKINNGAGPFDVWSMNFPGLKEINPGMLIFVINVPVKGVGRTLLVIAGPFSFGETNKIFEFGGENPSADVLVTLRRFVVISDMTYVAELQLWKEYV